MKLYTLIESFGLIPELMTFPTEEERTAYLRGKMLEGDLDDIVAATAEGNYNEEDAPGLDATQEEKFEFILGHGCILDGNKYEWRTDELEVGS